MKVQNEVKMSGRLWDPRMGLNVSVHDGRGLESLQFGVKRAEHIVAELSSCQIWIHSDRIWE